MPHRPARRVLVAGVGNVLRRDDGFGPAVVARLGEVPAGVEVLETGIGGMSIVQELLASRWDGLIIVDAVDRGAAPGTVFVIEPDIAPAEHIPDTHLANPDRVLMLASAMGALPERVLIVGCQPEIVEPTGEPLTDAVERAVAVGAAQVLALTAEWMAEPDFGYPPATQAPDEGGKMGHSEHEDEKAADAAMANPGAIEETPESVEDQPDAAKAGDEDQAVGYERGEED